MPSKIEQKKLLIMIYGRIGYHVVRKFGVLPHHTTIMGLYRTNR